MTQQDSSSGSLRADQSIHETLLAGHAVAVVAARFGITPAEVAAANERVRARREQLPPREAQIAAQRSAWQALYQLAIESFHNSGTAVEERTKVSKSSASDEHKVERITTTKRPDASFLRVAQAALTRQQELLNLEDNFTAKTAPRAGTSSRTAASEATPPEAESIIRSAWSKPRERAAGKPAAESTDAMQTFVDGLWENGQKNPALHTKFTDALLDLAAGQQVSHLRLPWDKKDPQPQVKPP